MLVCGHLLTFNEFLYFLWAIYRDLLKSFFKVSNNINNLNQNPSVFLRAQKFRQTVWTCHIKILSALRRWPTVFLASAFHQRFGFWSLRRDKWKSTACKWGWMPSARTRALSTSANCHQTRPRKRAVFSRVACTRAKIRTRRLVRGQSREMRNAAIMEQCTASLNAAVFIAANIQINLTAPSRSGKLRHGLSTNADIRLLFSFAKHYVCYGQLF